MELILLDSQLHEIGPMNLDIDFEIGNGESLNNFETMSALSGVGGVYIPNTEYGGVFEYSKENNRGVSVTSKGWTWRGLLTQAIIVPPDGADYMIVSGDANRILESLLENVLGGFFSVPKINSGLEITSYQFKLYDKVLDGIMSMLEENGYRLHIHAEKIEAGQPIVVYVEAVPAKILSGLYNEDSSVELTFENNRMGINHLICMGKGELQERMRVDLYINADGKVSKTQYYKGFNERTAYYDYANAESEEELIKNGKARLLELSSSSKLYIGIPDNIHLEVGDIVRGKKQNLVVEAPIVRKVLKVAGGQITVSYLIKGEN